MLAYTTTYAQITSQVRWIGKQVNDADSFTNYVQTQVRCKLLDMENRTEFEAHLQALASTDLEADTLYALLSIEEQHEDWEVGECLAQCLLEAEHGYEWPWNQERDKRTPRASLPGADLIGFGRVNGEVRLVFGEVKTSNDINTPPGVMSGRSGMIQQLENLARDVKLHNCLLKWLSARCKNTPYWPLYEEATQNYLRSRGKALLLHGLLMRDTNPHELDLRNRANALSLSVTSPMQVELAAWYLPTPVSNWAMLTLS